MNWMALVKVLANALIAFGLGFGAAKSAGATDEQAVIAGLLALVTGQAGLHQTKPTLRRNP